MMYNNNGFTPYDESPEDVREVYEFYQYNKSSPIFTFIRENMEEGYIS